MHSRRDEEGGGEGRKRRNWRSILFALLVILLIFWVTFLAIFVFTMFVSVGVGHAVILADPWAKTVSKSRVGPTWIVKAPWVSAVDIYYETDKIEMWTEWEEYETDKWRQKGTGDYPAIYSLSKDGLEIEVDVLVRWSLIPDKLTDLYRNFPNKNWKAVAIASIIREKTRDVISKYTAIEVIENRSQITDLLRTTIRTSLVSESSLAEAILESSIEVDLRSIDPPFEFIKAIREKLAAQQGVLKAEYERTTVLIQANATAQKLLIEAAAEGKAKIIIANSTKQAIQLILEASGGDASNATRIAELYLWVETLKQIAPDIGLFLITTGADGIPFIVSLPTNSTG